MEDDQFFIERYLNTVTSQLFQVKALAWICSITMFYHQAETSRHTIVMEIDGSIIHFTILS